MTSPTGGDYSLSVDILPDASNFGNRLRAALKNLPAVDIRVDPNTATFNTRLRAALRALPAINHEVRLDPATTGFNTRMRAALGALPAQRVNVAVEPATAGFNTRLRAALAALPNLSARVDISPNLAGFNARLRTALAALPNINVNVAAAPKLTGFNAQLRASLAALPILSTQVRIDPSVTGFGARLRTALAAMPPVYADIQLSPDMTGFRARLMAALGAMPNANVNVTLSFPGATAAGARIGREAARVFVLAFNAAMAAANWGTPGPGAAASGRAGGSAGGAYATTFRQVIAEALRNLPEPTIGVATGPAEQAIREIRASLDRLADERVGVTITGEQARAEVRRIREDLERLKAISPITVQAKADAAAAQLVLDRLEARLRAIGRDRTTNVRVRTDHSQLNGLQTALLGSTNRMQLLITAGLALGPAIVPAAAAAAAAIGAIGGAAIAAGAGLGVGILALSGVVGAVKALSDARNDAAKTAATEAKQDKQLATGADQVRSAVASLANTRAQAASQARQAAQTIADSERGLADAQRDALRAQQDITRAREEAKDALEDLDSSIKANATSIKQANLDLADAEAALAKVRNLPVDNRARIEAEIAYERAKQNLDDLTTRQGRLAEEKQRSDKVGIEGSAQVVAAQEKVNDAQRRVQDAERAVGEARTAAAEQGRQSAFSIAQAQQAVVAAQRSVATSAVSTAATSGAAMDTLREKMASLSPEGQNFARFLSGLQPELIGLRQSAEQALPGFEAGIRALLPALPAVNDFIRRVAASLGDMGKATGEALNGARLRPFFSYIDGTAVPTMEQLAHSAGNVAVGVANIIAAFSPMQQQVTGGLVDMTEHFERWSASLDRNNGFQRFLDYAISRGPIVMRTVSDIGGAVIHLLEASAPAGDVILSILSTLSHVIESIPIPVLTALLATMTALRVAALLTALPIASLGTTLSTLPGRLIAMTTSFGAARVGMASFAAALGGPVTIAIAAAALGIGYLMAQSAKHRAEVDRLKSSLDSYGNALRDGLTTESLANAQAILRQDKALRGLVDAADQAGISQQSLVAGLNGDRDARNRVIAQLDEQIKALNAQSSAAADAEGADSAAAKAASNRADELSKLRDAFAGTSAANADAADVAKKLDDEYRKLGDAVSVVQAALTNAAPSAEQLSSAINLVGSVAGEAGAKAETFALLAGKVAASNLDAADKADLFGRVLGQIGSAASAQGTTFDALAGTFNNIADSSLNANDKVQLLRRSLEQMYGAAIAQTEADEALVRTKIDLTTQINTNSAGFDLNTVKGKDNTQAVLDNRDALQAALVKAQEKYLQDIANGVAQDVARAAYEKNKNEILAGIPPTQRSTAAVGDLVKIYGAIPDKKTTAVTTPGLDKAIDELVQAYAIQQGIANGWTQDRIAAQVRILKSTILGGLAVGPGGVAVMKADGGLIEGWSPHSRADNIPAMLTAREFVQPVNTVDYYGVDVMERIRHRQIPRGLLRGYATGGLVTKVPEEWPVNVPVTAKMPFTIDELWAKWRAAQAPVGGGAEGIAGNASVGFPPWPSAHPGRGGPSGDSGVWRSIVALIRSTGPLSGTFGNAYRPGDPLWHGAGHAVDWMGFNQDALALFLAARRPLELIHRTPSRDYAYTRGVNKGSFNNSLMEAHRNHVHIAMADGGLVPNLGQSLAQTLNIPHLIRDDGGWIPPGLSVVDNRTGTDEWMFNDSQMQALVGANSGTGGKRGGDVHIDNFNAYAGQSPHEIARDLDWIGRHGG